MNHYPQYFPTRGLDDQLDVNSILFAGLSAGDGDRRVFTHEGSAVGVGELRHRVAQAQARLGRAGVKSGDRVALMLTNSVDHIALIYALVLIGAVWVPINVRLRGAGLLYIVTHSKPAMLVFDVEFEQVVSELGDVLVIRREELLDAPAAAAEEALICNREVQHHSTLCIIYTSGTTGAPKGVVFTHRMLRIASEAALLVASIQPGDHAFLWEPLCHIGGAQMLMMPFLVDAQLHVFKGFSASRFWTQWASSGATHLHYLGGVLDVLMQLPPAEAARPQSIRVAWGAGVSASAWEPIRRRFGCEIRECYGMTECSSFATLNTSGTPGSIGVPLPWIKVELLDPSGRPAASGELGEMVLSSEVEGVFLAEYLDNPEATQGAMRDGKLHTGDLARQLPNGEYAFVGRRTDSMRVRGENVSAWEVERIFVEHPAIKTVAALGVASAIGEQEIFLHVQFEEGAVLAWPDLVEWARPRLASFQLPRFFAAIDKFELTPSERIRKHLLPKSVDSAWDRTRPA